MTFKQSAVTLINGSRPVVCSILVSCLLLYPRERQGPSRSSILMGNVFPSQVDIQVQVKEYDEHIGRYLSAIS